MHAKILKRMYTHNYISNLERETERQRQIETEAQGEEVEQDGEKKLGLTQ